MTARPRKRCRTDERRRALQLLVNRPHGLTEDVLLLTHGFDSDMIADLVDEGLATGHRELVTAPGRTTTEVVRIRISDAGRQALEGSSERSLSARNASRGRDS